MPSYEFNCYGQLCAPWTAEMREAGVAYDEKTMFGNYDSEGFDRYGYSAMSAEGEYAGIGGGVDRLGHYEHDYLVMDEHEFAAL
jgi:hypothetical protein